MGAAGGLGFVIGGGLGAAHQALLLRDGPTGFLPYSRPRFFPVKVSGKVHTRHVLLKQYNSIQTHKIN